MKPETILNGLIKAHMVINNREVALNPDPKMIRLFDKSARQYHAFRNRILKMDKMARSIIDDLNMEIQMRDARIAELEADNEALDAYVDEAKELIDQHYERAIKAEARFKELEARIDR